MNTFFKVIDYIFARSLFCFFYRPRFRSVGSGSFFFRPKRLEGCRNASIGQDVRVLHGARLEIHRDEARLTIGHGTNIGHNFFCSCFDRISVGEGCLISDNVAIIDNAHINDPGKSPVKTGVSFAPVHIHRDVTIYRNSTILKGVTIGRGAIIGANTLVKSDVPDYGLVVGSPGRLVKVYEC